MSDSHRCAHDGKGSKRVQGGGCVLDAVEGHDAVLERNFKLGFGFLNLLLADVGLRNAKIRHCNNRRGWEWGWGSHMQAVDGVCSIDGEGVEAVVAVGAARTLKLARKEMAKVGVRITALAAPCQLAAW